MSYDIGPRIGIDGETQFKTALAELNSRIKAFGSELRATSSAFDQMDQSEANLTKQNDVLGRSIQAQKDKIALLTTQLDKQKAKLAELGAVLEATRAREDASVAEVRAAEAAYLRQSTAVNTLTGQLGRATTELNDLERNLSENTRELERAAEESSAFAQAQREAEAAAEALRQQQSQLTEELNQSCASLESASEAMESVNQAALIAGAALAGLGLASTKVGMDFEEQMSKVESISGASAEEMIGLENAAKQMGATTKFSASESGQALEYMAMAGWKSQQMIDGLPGIMNLAAASGEELGLVSDIVTDSLTAFGLQASDSAHFADVLAQASAASNTSVAMMGDTFRYAAPVAGALGYSIEDMSVAIGLMANAGIKGEMAGTSLRGMLTNLAKPTAQTGKYIEALGLSMTDAAGEVKPMSALLAELREKFAGLTEAQKAEYAAGIAGKEAMSGMLALVNSSDTDFDKLSKAIANSSGTAKGMADIMNDNLKGQLTLLKSAAEGVGIAFYEKFGGQAKKAVEQLAGSVGKFGQDLASGKLDTTLQAVATAAAAGAGALVVLNAALAWKDLQNYAAAAKLGGQALTNFKGATIASTLAQQAHNLALAMTPWGWFAVAAGAAAAAFVTFQVMSNNAETASSRLNARIRELSDGLDEQASKQKEFAEASSTAVAGIEQESSRISGYVDELKSLTDAKGRVAREDEGRAALLADQINRWIPGAVSALQDETGAYYTLTDGVKDAIEAKRREMILSAWESDYQNALKARKEAQDKVTEATRVHGAAVQEVDRIQREMLSAGPRELDVLSMKLGEAQRKVGETAQEMELAKQIAQGYSDTIIGYETATSAAASGTDEFDGAISRLNTSIVHNTGENQKALEDAVINEKLKLDGLVGIYQQSYASMSETERKHYETGITEQKAALDAQVAQARDGGILIPENFAASMEEGKGVFAAASWEVLEAGRQELEAGGVSMREMGQGYDLLLANGLLDNVGLVKDAGGEAGAMAIDGFASAESGAAEIGKNLALGLAQGIRNNTNPVSIAAAALGATALWATRNVTAVKSPSRKFMEIGGFLAEGLAIGMKDGEGKVIKTAEELSQAILKSATEWVDDKKFYNDLAAQDELAFWEKLKTLTGLGGKELAKIDRNIYKARQEASRASLETSKKWIEQEKFYKRLSAEEEVEAWQRVVDRKNLITTQQLEAEKSLYTAQQKLIDEQTKRVEEYEQSLSARENNLRSFAGLFSEIDKGTEVSGQQLLKNLQGQVALFEGWQTDMEKLAADPAMTEALLAELREMGPKAAKEIHALAASTESVLPEYAKEFAKLGGLIKTQAESELAGQPIELSIGAATLNEDQAVMVVGTSTSTLCKAIADNAVPLEKSTDDVAVGMKNKILDRQIDFYKAGINVMDGLNKGLREQGQVAIGTARQVADDIIREMQRALDIHSPSRKMRDLVGKPAAQGFFVGFEGEMEKNKGRAQVMSLDFTQKMHEVAKQVRASIPLPSPPQDQFARLGEGIVNGVAQAAQTGSGVSQPIVLQVNLDSKQIARQTFDPLKAVARQKGVSLG